MKYYQHHQSYHAIVSLTLTLGLTLFSGSLFADLPGSNQSPPEKLELPPLPPERPELSTLPPPTPNSNRPLARLESQPLPPTSKTREISIHSGTRLALVIGNANYTKNPLKNPVNDAHDMAKVLEGLGFQVTLEIGLGLDEMIKALTKFSDQLSDSGVGLFYFSGHGIQYNNLNYLIPIDVNNLEDNEMVITRYTLGVDEVLKRMEGNNKNGVNIIILDACRNNPFERGFKGATSGGLAEMRAPIGSLIAYATTPNTVARDNPTGSNGMYTKHLLAVLQEMPQESILDLFTEVTHRVAAETNDQQVPWKADTLRRKFCLAARGCERVATPPSVGK